jgi:hypothetical protein
VRRVRRDAVGCAQRLQLGEVVVVIRRRHLVQALDAAAAHDPVLRQLPFVDERLAEVRKLQIDSPENTKSKTPVSSSRALPIGSAALAPPEHRYDLGIELLDLAGERECSPIVCCTMVEKPTIFGDSATSRAAVCVMKSGISATTAFDVLVARRTT